MVFSCVSSVLWTVCKVVWGDVVQYIRFGLASVIVCSMICCGLNISHSEYLVRNPVQAALQSNKRQKAKFFLNIFGLA